MLVIYTPKINSRIEYVAEVCFKHVFKLDYQITEDLREFEKTLEPCFWYASSKVSEKPGIICDPMMIDTKLIINSPGRTMIDGNMVLFPTETVKLPNFDVFAASLWHVARMEEYNHNSKDIFKRFSSDISITRKIGILNKPMVNIWTEMLLNSLKNLYPDLEFEKPAYKFIPTIDIDSFFMYRGKGFFRSFAGFTRDLFKKDYHAVKTRFRVLTRKQKDPWNCFDNINKLHKEQGLSPYYFFLMAKLWKLDRNISPSKRSVKYLIRDLVKSHTIGIHNSYRGNFKKNVWSKELKLLEKTARSEVFSSRQHYLLVKFPYTFRDLVKIGIKRDFSLVFYDMPGFRMGVSVPIPFFDLLENKKTDLWLYPTMITDKNLHKYQSLSKEEAISQAVEIINYTKQYGGTLVTLWHNESLSDYGVWQDQNEVYKEILKEAVG
ncbi:MAG: hypothetical protein GX793_06190 [Bacteroidales bacterium]|jgi:hypothetical protein|nr:polysaccharide deacetylase family protein [Bacteroidales bacterium]MCK9498361.1 polysaccharide deacetylase family protein [Bacteroidales bacterium]MDY0314937.1 polysaccharide deacetylase family protein [Bacteroidales bacterium]NLB86632.1 hypothetical protein [Bacteroidales bacterium]